MGYAKIWVFVKKGHQQKHKKTEQQNTKTNSILQLFFALEPSKIVAPVWEWWRFQEIVMKMMINFEFSGAHCFYLKTQFLVYSKNTWGPESAVFCRSNSIFSLYSSKTGLEQKH